MSGDGQATGEAAAKPPPGAGYKTPVLARRNEQILNLHDAGVSTKWIAARFKMEAGNVRVVIFKARAQGDPRARLKVRSGRPRGLLG